MPVWLTREKEKTKMSVRSESNNSRGLLVNKRPALMCLATFQKKEEKNWWLKCCFTSTGTPGLLGTGAQDCHLDFHTAPDLYTHTHSEFLDLKAPTTAQCHFRNTVEQQQQSHRNKHNKIFIYKDNKYSDVYFFASSPQKQNINWMYLNTLSTIETDREGDRHVYIKMERDRVNTQMGQVRQVTHVVILLIHSLSIESVVCQWTRETLQVLVKQGPSRL